MIVENVAGAGGMTGADRVAKAAPGGYTFLQGTVGTQAQNPTAIKQGLDVEAYTWNAFFLPKGTPAPIVQKLRAATLAAMKTPAIREKLEAAGLTLVADDRSTPESLGKFVESEIAKWAAPIKASGASAD